METLAERVAAVRARMAAACRAAGRDPAEVRLLPVTKTHPAETVLAAAALGFGSVGENRVQEAAAKRAALAALPGAPPVAWELIGHLQSNKAKAAVETFARVQTVDSEKLARLLDRFAGERGLALPVLLEVNAGDDPNKEGVSLAAAPALAEAVAALPNLRLDGLMTVAPLLDDPAAMSAAARRAFAALRELRDALRARTGQPLPELSMGMSGDLAEAVAEGSTLVRVGSALFGARG